MSLRHVIPFLLLSLLAFAACGPAESPPTAVPPTTAAEELPLATATPIPPAEELPLPTATFVPDIPLEELPPLQTTEFEAGICLVELTTAVPAFRANNLNLVQGTLPAGIYGTISLIETPEGNQYFGIPMPDTRTVFVAYSEEVIPSEGCGLTPAATSEGESELATDTEPAPFVGITWQWVGTSSAQEGDETSVANPENYTILFNEDGTANLQADCNVGTASYTAADSSIDIQLGALTMAFCGEESQDQQFLRDLDAAVIYFMQEGNLFFDMPFDTGTMQFQPQP
jgi:heat shock protein HslJ